MKIKSQHIVTDGRLEIPKSILVKAGGYISRGVKGIAIEDGHLIFTLTDGTTADLGDIRGAQGLQGPKGDKGDTGPQGPQGEKGNTGAQGPQGETGARGETGPQGDRGEKGDPGPQGPQGETGPKGETGPEGPRGPQGEAGPKGDTGPKGADGITPTIGANGNWYLGSTETGKPSRGETGAKGDKGETGPQGPTGPAGPQGEQGAQGETGPRGPQGEQGLKGDTGDTGPQGDVGPRGPQGETGPQGPKGDTGSGFVVKGYYSTEEALQAAVASPAAGDAYGVGMGEPYDIYIYDGVSKTWVNNGPLQGAKGDTGPQGPKGETGAQGEQGPRGLQGDKGETGPQGLQGPQGETGPKGADGITPAIGANGNWFLGSTDTGKPSRGETGAKGDTGPQGPQGEAGAQGPSGYTPVKGLDYFTEADKQEIATAAAEEVAAGVDEKITTHDSSSDAHLAIRNDVTNSKAYFVYLDGAVQDGNLTLAGDPGTMSELVEIYMNRGAAFLQDAELPYVYTHFSYSSSNPDATPVILPFVGVDKDGTGAIFAGTYFDKEQTSQLYAISVGIQRGSGVIHQRNIKCEVISGKLGTSGDGSNVTAAFTAATTRAQLTTGEKLSVLFGKIAKWFADLGSLAFKSTVAKSDLAADVQTSLGKADTALQSAPVTSVNGQTGAVSVTVPSASTSTPLMDGTASVGSGTAYALGNHRHPTDTSRVPTTRTVNGKALSANITLGAMYTATLTASGWTTSGSWKTQTVSVTGLKASYNAAPFVDVSLTGTDAAGDAELAEAWAGIATTAIANTAVNSITVKFPATVDTPTANIPIRVTTYD